MSDTDVSNMNLKQSFHPLRNQIHCIYFIFGNGRHITQSLGLFPLPHKKGFCLSCSEEDQLECNKEFTLKQIHVMPENVKIPFCMNHQRFSTCTHSSNTLV